MPLINNKRSKERPNEETTQTILTANESAVAPVSTFRKVKASWRFRLNSRPFNLECVMSQMKSGQRQEGNRSRGRNAQVKQGNANRSWSVQKARTDTYSAAGPASKTRRLWVAFILGGCLLVWPSV